MGNFDKPYWDLEQASGWVVYRKREVVEKLGPPATERLSAMLLYPSMDPSPRVGKISELTEAFEMGTIIASGRRNPGGSHYEPISTLDWSGMICRPLLAYRRDDTGQKVEPWVDIRVEAKSIKKLWPPLPEQHDRAKFDWDLILSLYKEVVMQQPESSQNEQILELQALFEEQAKKNPPSRSTIQARIKRWVPAGQID